MSAMLCLVISAHAHQVVSSCPRVLPRFVKSEGERRSGGGKVRLSQLTGQRSAFSTNSRLGVDHPAVVLGELLTPRRGPGHRLRSLWTAQRPIAFSGHCARKDRVRSGLASIKESMEPPAPCDLSS